MAETKQEPPNSGHSIFELNAEHTKGQLISKCLFGVDQNSYKNIVRISALKFFVASLGFPGSFFGASWGLSK